MFLNTDDDARQLRDIIERIDPPAHIRGETGLWRAVIVQALMDAASQSRKSEAALRRQEAIYWLTGASKDFVMVCDHAGFDPGYVRRMTKRALIMGCKWRAAPGEGKRSRLHGRKNKSPPPVGDDGPRAPAALVIAFPLARIRRFS